MELKRFQKNNKKNKDRRKFQKDNSKTRKISKNFNTQEEMIFPTCSKASFTWSSNARK